MRSLKTIDGLLALIAILGFISIILVGFLGQLITSIIIAIIFVFLWLSLITYKIYRFENPADPYNESVAVITDLKVLPYPTYSQFLDNKIGYMSTRKKKIKTSADFFNWQKFSMIFWVKIEEDFLHAQNNRYIFSYTTDTSSGSNYPNAFYLGIRSGGNNWIFCIKGNDPANSTTINFTTGDNYLGWKLFSVLWDKSSSTLEFLVDAGHVHSASRKIKKESWPETPPDFQFHLGGWQDSWDGGLSFCKFFNYRLFERLLSQGDIEKILDEEGKLLNKIET